MSERQISTYTQFNPTPLRTPRRQHLMSLSHNARAPGGGRPPAAVQWRARAPAGGSPLTLPPPACPRSPPPLLRRRPPARRRISCAGFPTPSYRQLDITGIRSVLPSPSGTLLPASPIPLLPSLPLPPPSSQRFSSPLSSPPHPPHSLRGSVRAGTRRQALPLLLFLPLPLLLPFSFTP